MSTRTKVAAATAFGSWDDADKALQELGEISRRVEGVEAKANAKMDTIKEALAAESQVDLARKQRLEIDLKAWTEANVESLVGRSRKLNFGIVFLRITTALKPLPKWTWAKVLERLLERKRTDLIRTKQEADKDGIAAANIDEAQLKDLGMRFVNKDSFTYEVAQAEAQPTT